MIAGKQERFKILQLHRARSSSAEHSPRALSISVGRWWRSIAAHRLAPRILATGSCCSCAIPRRYGAVSQQAAALYAHIRTQASPFVIQSLRESRVICGVSHVLSARGAAWTPRYASIMFASYHSSYLVTIIFLIEIPSRKYLGI